MMFFAANDPAEHQMRRLTAALALLLLPGLAQAALLGTIATVRYELVNGLTVINSADPVLIRPGAELSCPSAAGLCAALTADTQTLDLGDATLRFDYAGDGGVSFITSSANRLIFDDLDAGGPIIGVTLATDMLNLDLGRVSFTGDSVTLDMRGVVMPNAAHFFEAGLTSGVTEVPAPAAVPSFSLGLLGLALTRRRRAA